MIRFSFSSFYMSLLFVNVIILFLYLAFRSQTVMFKLGLTLLGSAVFFVVLRMILPFEFLFLSHNIYFPKIISYILGEFLHAHFWGGKLSCWSILQIIWLIGIPISGIRYWYTEQGISEAIKARSQRLPESAPACQVLAKIQEEFPKTRGIEIYSSPLADSPMIYGIRHPRILMPEGLELNESQLYIVLRHEIAHHLHHDPLIKFILQILCIIYWWNPFCKRLRDQASNILEMRTDRTVAKNPKEKEAYAECLLYVLNHAVKSRQFTNPSSTISLCKKPPSVLEQRFHMLLTSKEQSLQKKAKGAIFLFMVTLFLLSFTYIFEASYPIPANDPFNSLEPTAENSYFVERSDGKYDFYLDGEFYGTENSLEYYNESIPIYQEEVMPQ